MKSKLVESVHSLMARLKASFQAIPVGAVPGISTKNVADPPGQELFDAERQRRLTQCKQEQEQMKSVQD